MVKPVYKLFWIKLLLIVSAGVLFITLAVNPTLKKILASQVKDKLVGNFYYTYENLSVDLLSRSVTLHNVNWKFPKDTTVFNQGGRIKRFKISGISLLSLIGNTNLNIHSIEFDSLDLLTRIASPQERDSIQKNEINRSSLNFYSFIKGNLNSLKVGTIMINHGNATWLDPKNKKIWRKINDVQFEATSIELDSAIAATNNGWFVLHDIKLDGTNGELFLADSLHKIHVSNVQLNYKNQTITLDSLQLIPLFTKAQMGSVKRYETDRMEMTIPQLNFNGIDLKRVMTRNELRIQSVHIDNMNFVAFRDKTPPFPPHHFPPLPQIALKQANLNLVIDSLLLNHAFIKYEQLSESTHQAGEVFFSDMNAGIYNITNDSLRYTQNDKTTMTVKSNVMGLGPLSVNVVFNLRDNNGDHWINGSLGKFDLRALNKIIKPITAISIRSGQVNQLKFAFRLNNDVSDGQITFLYSNLKIDKLNESNLLGDGLDNSITSFLANTFLIKKSNPSRRNDPRIGIVHFNRVKEKSIFNFWWKSLFEGMKSTVMTVEESK